MSEVPAPLQRHPGPFVGSGQAGKNFRVPGVRRNRSQLVRRLRVYGLAAGLEVIENLPN